jgi:hypothetical protein
MVLPALGAPPHEAHTSLHQTVNEEISRSAAIGSNVLGFHIKVLPLCPEQFVINVPVRSDGGDALRLIYPRLMRCQKLERRSFLEIGCLVPAQVGIAMEGELADVRIGLEIDLIELYPHKARTCGVLEEVNIILLVRNRTPDCGRYVGLGRRADATGHADVAHDTENGGNGLALIGGLGGGIDVKRRTGEAIGSAVGTRQHNGAADLLPVFVQCELVAVDRRVGHDLVLPAVVDDQFAFDVLENG